MTKNSQPADAAASAPGQPDTTPDARIHLENPSTATAAIEVTGPTGGRAGHSHDAEHSQDENDGPPATKLERTPSDDRKIDNHDPAGRGAQPINTVRLVRRRRNTQHSHTVPLKGKIRRTAKEEHHARSSTTRGKPDDQEQGYTHSRMTLAGPGRRKTPRGWRRSLIQRRDGSRNPRRRRTDCPRTKAASCCDAGAAPTTHTRTTTASHQSRETTAPSAADLSVGTSS